MDSFKLLFGNIQVAFYCTVFLCIVNVYSQTIDGPPRPISVKVDDTAIITCRVSGDVMANSLEWWKYISETERLKIFPRNDSATKDNSTDWDPNKFEIEGIYNLKIKNAQLTDAGQYGCRLVKDSEPLLADVVVIDTPVATVKPAYELGTATFACHVEYASRLDHELPESHTPKLKAYVNGRRMLNVQESITDLGNNHTLTLTMTYIGYMPDNGKNLRCEVATQYPCYMDFGTQTITIFWTTTPGPITGPRTTANLATTTTPTQCATGGLSRGEIAGIVISCLLFVALVLVIIRLVYVQLQLSRLLKLYKHKGTLRMSNIGNNPTIDSGRVDMQNQL